MLIIKSSFGHNLKIKQLLHQKPPSGLFLFALFEGQPAFGVVDEDLVHLVLRDAPDQHLRHDVVQDVRVAVAAILGEPVLGVDVVRDHDLVLVALLHQERQAEHQQRKVKT